MTNHRAPKRLAIPFAATAVCMATWTPAATALDKTVNVNVLLDPATAEANTLAISVRVNGSEADSAQSMVIGESVVALDLNFDSGMATATGLSFVSSILMLSDVDLHIDVGGFGATDLSTTGMTGNILTLAPPGSIVPPGQFPVSEHLLTFNGGTVDYASNGAAAILVGSGSMDLATDPVEGTGFGTGQLDLDLISQQGKSQVYDVLLTVPVMFADTVVDDPVIVDLGAGGTLIARGQFTVELPLTGDANNDNRVSGSDLIAVQQNFSARGAADGLLLGDANDDGQVSGADLISAQQNFGMAVAPAGKDLPEPATVVLLALGTLVFLRR